MEGHESCGSCGGEGVGTINIQEIIRRAQQKRKEQRWSEKIKELLKTIEEEKPRDRLEYAIAFTKLFHSLTWCIAGWGQWLGFQIVLKGTPVLANYANFERLTLDECKTIYPKVKKVVIDMLNSDYEISYAKEEEAIALAAKKAKKEKTTKKPKAKTKKTKKSKTDRYIH